MSPRGRRGGRGKRGRHGQGDLHAPGQDTPGNGQGLPEDGEQNAPEQAGAQPPPAGRGDRPHNGRSDRRGGRGHGERGRRGKRERPEERGSHEEHGGNEERVQEVVVDEEDLHEEEIAAHRETTADARSGAAASPQSVAALTAFLRSMGIDPRRDPQYTVTAQLTADFLAERTAGLRREPGPLRPTRYQGTPSTACARTTSSPTSARPRSCTCRATGSVGSAPSRGWCVSFPACLDCKRASPRPWPTRSSGTSSPLRSRSRSAPGISVSRCAGWSSARSS